MFIALIFFFLLDSVHTQDDAGADLDLESMSVGGDREYIISNYVIQLILEGHTNIMKRNKKVSLRPSCNVIKKNFRILWSRWG